VSVVVGVTSIETNKERGVKCLSLAWTTARFFQCVSVSVQLCRLTPKRCALCFLLFRRLLLLEWSVKAQVACVL